MNQTLGIMGGGQLARMLALAALRMGITPRVFSTQDDESTRFLADRVISTSVSDAEAFARSCDGVTAEYEYAPDDILDAMAAITPVTASLNVLRTKRDRRKEKALLDQMQMPLATWQAADTHADLAAAVSVTGMPCRVKTAIGGYDGKGQWRITDAAQLAHIPADAAPFVVEAEIKFDYEFAITGARNASGQIEQFAPTLTEHRNGILHRATAGMSFCERPAIAEARRLLPELLAHMQYTGMLTIEWFAVGDHVLINEIAPRVHNSAHWTLDAGDGSQFEQQVRAALNLPLLTPMLDGYARMWNVIGAWPDRQQLLQLHGLVVHDYQKGARSGRKIGHLNMSALRVDDLDHRGAWLDAHVEPR